MRLLLNRIRTPDGTVLTSYYTHDFNVHMDKNGQQYGVDGGQSYAKRIGNTNECEDLSVWVDEEKVELYSEFEIIRENLYWGTRGKDGKQSLKWVQLMEMSDQHLDAMVNVYTGPVDTFYKKCFKLEIEYRNKLGIVKSE
jgi:hypothetical protein